MATPGYSRRSTDTKSPGCLCNRCTIAEVTLNACTAAIEKATADTDKKCDFLRVRVTGYVGNFCGKWTTESNNRTPEDAMISGYILEALHKTMVGLGPMAWSYGVSCRHTLASRHNEKKTSDPFDAPPNYFSAPHGPFSPCFAPPAPAAPAPAPAPVAPTAPAPGPITITHAAGGLNGSRKPANSATINAAASLIATKFASTLGAYHTKVTVNDRKPERKYISTARSDAATAIRLYNAIASVTGEGKGDFEIITTLTPIVLYNRILPAPEKRIPLTTSTQVAALASAALLAATNAVAGTCFKVSTEVEQVHNSDGIRTQKISASTSETGAVMAKVHQAVVAATEGVAATEVWKVVTSLISEDEQKEAMSEVVIGAPSDSRPLTPGVVTPSAVDTDEEEEDEDEEKDENENENENEGDDEGDEGGEDAEVVEKVDDDNTEYEHSDDGWVIEG